MTRKFIQTNEFSKNWDILWEVNNERKPVFDSILSGLNEALEDAKKETPGLKKQSDHRNSA